MDCKSPSDPGPVPGRASPPGPPQPPLPLAEAEALPEHATEFSPMRGSRVVVVGTAHLSRKSAEDVRQTIRAVAPSVVFLELDVSRKGMLKHPLPESSASANGPVHAAGVKEDGGILAFIRRARRRGGGGGVVTNMIEAITMAQMKAMERGGADIDLLGGEFRAAVDEVRSLASASTPTSVVLGDRPISVTLRRIWNGLTWFEVVWLALQLLWTFLFMSFSEEDVEKLKLMDIAEILEELKSFPHIENVLLHERNLYMAINLKNALRIRRDIDAAVNAADDTDATTKSLHIPAAVAVVGLAHVSGLREEWENVLDQDQAEDQRVLRDLSTSKWEKARGRGGVGMKVAVALGLAVVVAAVWAILYS